MSRHTTPEAQYERLRKYLTPALSGPNTDAILRALASSVATPLVDLLEQINDQFFIISASGNYLDAKLSEYGVSRPPAVGLTDELFRELGIAVINKKQIRSLILNILSIIFGEDTTNANTNALNYEPYNLKDGDTLKVSFDGQPAVSIVFTSGQFTNIAAATAEEVADAITKSLRQQGKTGSAYALNDGTGTLVVLLSDTKGPSSEIQVLGGAAQNALQFAGLRTTTAVGGSTEWTVTATVDGGAKFTWVGGINPSLQYVQIGDYVNIFDSVFDANVPFGSNNTNQGVFEVIDVDINSTYFVVQNYLVQPITVGTTPSTSVIQQYNNSVLFYQPVIHNISSLFRFASVYQSQANLLEIIMPASSQIIRRNRIGAAYMNDSSDPALLELGPYMFDPQQNFTLLKEQSVLTQKADSASGQLIFVANSSDFPDAQGYVMLDFGTKNQEGPIPYLNVPSTGSILLSPAYVMQKTHAIGASVNQVLRQGVIPDTNGDSYQGYLTTVALGRIYAQDLINEVKAAGLNIVFTIVYPSTVGLSNNSEYFVWGET